MSSALTVTGRRLTPADLTAEGNAFTLLRWLLATSVMFSHGWDLTTGYAGLDPSVPILGFAVSQLAVFLFFTVSGFLVTGSLVKRGLGPFALARALRLIPGLWVMLFVVAFGLGAAFSTEPFGSYIVDPAVWRYIAKNASMLSADYRLPGVFTDLPNEGVNGSLWTIAHEVRCYIVLGIFGALGALRSRRWLLAFLIVAVVVHILVPLDAVPALDRARRLALSFLIGVVAYQWRDTIRWSWPLALAAAAGALALVRLPLVPAVSMVAIQFAFAYLAGVATFCVPNRVKAASAAMPDYSYGIYIYAYPAQQVVIATGLGTTPLTNIPLAFILLLPFAAASWHLVESPALRLKPKAVKSPPRELSAGLTDPESTRSSVQ